MSLSGLSDVNLVDRARHRHDHDELTWVASGSCTLVIDDVRWQIDTDRALVIPAGVEHVVIPRPDSLVFPLLFPEGIPSLRHPRIVARTGPLDTCVRVLLQAGLATPEALGAARDSVRTILGDDTASDDVPVMPTDARARDVATRLLEHLASPRGLEDWARTVHTSGKTLQRCFQRETGMTFPEWRTRARLGAARQDLQRGDAVAAVAKSIGYSTPSAFITAFRRRYGITPGDYRDRLCPGA